MFLSGPVPPTSSSPIPAEIYGAPHNYIARCPTLQTPECNGNTTPTAAQSSSSNMASLIGSQTCWSWSRRRGRTSNNGDHADHHHRLAACVRTVGNRIARPSPVGFRPATGQLYPRGVR